jgi:hypothetical protein
MVRRVGASHLDLEVDRQARQVLAEDVHANSCALRIRDPAIPGKRSAKSSSSRISRTSTSRQPFFA